MQDRIKEHDRDIRLARTETSAVSEHAHDTGHKPLWNEIKFIDRDPYYCRRRVKEAIHIFAWPVDLIARRKLAVCSRNVAIYITRDYIVRQTKNLAFVFDIYLQICNVFENEYFQKRERYI